MANPFDQFDPNPFDAFDAPVRRITPTAEERQLATSNLARLRQLREEQDAAMAAPKYRVGIQLPFMDEPIASAPIPAELAAFGSEAAKSVLPTGAGLAAASAVTPYSNTLANVLQAVPGAGRLAAPVVRLGVPLVAGGVGAMGTRLAEDAVLPEILPDASARSYELGTELAAQNPTAAMLGQFAGAGPFFRPGLPINSTGGARLATPLVAGGIGGGIEGAQQLAEGDFDAQRLALATAGSALLNRETRLGARVGPNLVLPKTDEALLTGLTERMAGKTPEQQLAVVKQETTLNADILTPNQERAALDIQQGLEAEIAQKNALEDGIAAQEKAQADAQKAVDDQQKAIEAAQQPPELPKSAQILAEPVTKTPSIANVATEVATQTKNSPYALQEQLNKMTTPIAAEVAGGTPPVAAAAVPDQTKQQMIDDAVALPTTEWQYVVQRGFTPDDAGYTQVDAISNGENTVSSNPADLRKAGADIPDVPDWVPQGRYTLDQIKQFIEQGEPKKEITLFHGGPALKGDLREPAFLTTDPNGAKWYATERGGDTGTVSEFRAEIKRPLDIDEADGIRTIVRLSKAAGVPVEITGKIGEQGWEFFSPEIAKHSDYDGSSVADLLYVPKVRNALRKAGYDAVKVSDMLSNDFIETYIALDTKKLKPVKPTPNVPTQSTPQPAAADQGAARQAPAPPPSLPSLASASSDSIDDWLASVRKYEKDIDVAILGDELAKEHRRLTRTANSSNYSAGDPRVKAAEARIAEIESTLTPEQQDIFYGIKLPPGFVGTDEATAIARAVNDIDSAGSAADIVRQNSKLIQKFLRAAGGQEALGPVDSELLSRLTTRARELGVTPQKIVEGYFRYRSRFEGDDVFELAGTTPEQLARFMGGTPEPAGALPDPGVVDVEARPQAPSESQLSTIPKSVREQNVQFGVENIPFGETAVADVQSGTGASTMQALAAAGYPVKDRLAMVYGEKPFPTKAKFLKDVEGSYILDGLEYLKKVENEIRTLGSDPRKANLPKPDDFDNPADFYRAAVEADQKMRRTGMSVAAAMVENKQMPKPFKQEAPVPAEQARPITAELRANNAGLDLPPVSSLSAAQKLAELQAGGVKTYAGKPISEANGAQLSNALGKFRRRELGAIRPGVAATAGGGAVGGVAGFVATDREPGETDEEFNARRLRNAALGAAAGAGAGGGAVSLMSRGAQTARAARATTSSAGRAEVPATGEDQGVRRTAEKIIENKSYPDRLTRVLSEDPDILYDKFKLNELKAIVKGSDNAQLETMMASPNKSESLAAMAELANRYSLSPDPALHERGAALYSQFAQNMTNPAQMLGLGKLIESPDGYVAALNEALKKVKRKMSKPQEDQLKDLARKAIKAEQDLDAATVRAENDFTPENQKAYIEAEQGAASARKAVDDFTHRVAPESWSDILSKIVQGNLLTPLSILVNPTSNLIFQPVMRASSSLGSMADEIISTVFRRPRVLGNTNPLPGKGEMKAFADGVRIGAKELLTGPGVDSYAKAEVQRGFKPIRALVQAFADSPVSAAARAVGDVTIGKQATEKIANKLGGSNLAVREDGTVALSDRGKKLLEGTFGAPAETAFRFLNLGDKPFRRSEEARVLFEQARLKGLKGRDLEKFLLFPDKNTQKLLETEGRAAIFAQDNPGVRKVSQLLDHGIADLLDLPPDSALRGFLKVAARTQVPYRQVPVNILSTALNYAVPEVAFARALIKGKNDRRGALQALGQGVLGTMMYQGANWLWDNGLISEPADKDAKIRSAQYEQFGPAKINVSGLQRALAGGDPKWQSGDTAADWGRFGPPAFVFHIFTSNAAKGRKESARTGEDRQRTYGPGRFAQDRISSFPGMANFALDQSFMSGTSAFLEAMRDWDQFGDRWAQNAFRAVSSILVPNTVEAFARTQYKYIPELRGDSLGETLKNVWNFKTLQLPRDERSMLKRDIWGDPILRTQGGKNPYVDQFLDPFRSVTKTNEPFKQALVDLFQETYSPDVYPSIPTRDFTLNGVSVKLNPKDYEDYQRFIGTARREFANEVVADSSFSAPETIPEEKILMLQNAYSQGQKAGSAMLQEDPGFFERYPELMDQPAASPEESRVISRDVKARARQRLDREANVFDQFDATVSP